MYSTIGKEYFLGTFSLENGDRVCETPMIKTMMKEVVTAEIAAVTAVVAAEMAAMTVVVAAEMAAVTALVAAQVAAVTAVVAAEMAAMTVVVAAEMAAVTAVVAAEMAVVTAVVAAGTAWLGRRLNGDSCGSGGTVTDRVTLLCRRRGKLQ
jgi:hypothetical protein